jgi:hypothetical protein
MDTPLRIAFGPAVCSSLAEGGDREWLVADGSGGYAMGTVCGLRTRRYHGMLVPAVGGPSARRLGLVALDPVLVLPSGTSVCTSGLAGRWHLPDTHSSNRST